MAESTNQTAGEGAQAAAHGCFVCNVAMPFLEQSVAGRRERTLPRLAGRVPEGHPHA